MVERMVARAASTSLLFLPNIRLTRPSQGQQQRCNADLDPETAFGSIRIRIRNTVEKMDDLYLGNKPNVKVSVESIKATGKIVKCLSTGTWIFKVFFSYFFKASEKGLKFFFSTKCLSFQSGCVGFLHHVVWFDSVPDRDSKLNHSVRWEALMVKRATFTENIIGLMAKFTGSIFLYKTASMSVFF